MDLAPYSGAVEAGSNLINAAISRIWPDKTKVAEIQGQLQELIAKGEFDVELAGIQAVNATMQEEARSEHWPQYSWRPAIGFAFAAETGMIGLTFTMLMTKIIFGHGLGPDVMPQITTLITAFSVLFAAQGAILGVSAAGRSFEKWQRNGK